MVVICSLLLSPLGFGQNLLKYRDFEFGMNVEAVLNQTKMDAASAKTTYAVPDLIQTVQWNRQGYFPRAGDTDPVRSVRFDFYNNQLFKIVASYNARQLEGMTASDLIEAISKVYGPASITNETIVVSPYTGYEDRQKVLARWENGEATFSLFQSSSGGEFRPAGIFQKTRWCGTAFDQGSSSDWIPLRPHSGRSSDRKNLMKSAALRTRSHASSICPIFIRKDEREIRRKLL
jgi:hypothetical protein